MLLIHSNGFRYFQFPSLAGMAGVWHGIFARSVWNDSANESSLNVGLQCGDTQQQVWENRRRMLAQVGGDFAVFARQVHGNKVGVWSKPASEQRTDKRDYTYLEGDALVTRMPGQALFIQVADCQPVLMVDPNQRVVANVHSGWRGSIQNVIGRTVQTMVRQFGCRPRDIHCGIGPSLGPCCLEFIHYRDEIPTSMWHYGRGQNLFDFWKLSKDQLEAAGVLPEHIASSELCTRCNQRLFFSYRGERQAGRFAAVIGMGF